MIQGKGSLTFLKLRICVLQSVLPQDLRVSKGRYRELSVLPRARTSCLVDVGDVVVLTHEAGTCNMQVARVARAGLRTGIGHQG